MSKSKKMNRLTAYVCFFLFCSAISSAQQVTLATPASEIQRACKVDPAGGYVTVGYNATSGKMQYVRFSADKIVSNKNEYAVTGRTFRPSDIQPAIAAPGLSAGFWITGNANTTATKKMFVQRIASNGTTLWSKEANTTLERGARAVVPFGNRVIVVGMKSDGLPMLTCFSADGSVFWGPFTYQHPTFTLNAESATLVDNHVIVTGSSQRVGEAGKAMTFAINALTGTAVWFANYGVNTTAQNTGLDIATQLVGGIRHVAVIGSSLGGTNRDIYFMRINPSNGALLAGKLISETTSSTEEGRSICAANGKWAITGRRMTDRVFFMELSSAGVPVATSARTYPLAKSSSIVTESIDRDAAGNYFIAAHAGSFDYHDIWVTPNGQSPCSASAAFSMTNSTVTASYTDTNLSRANGNSWSSLGIGMIDFSSTTTYHHNFNVNPTISQAVICPCDPGPSELCINPSSGTAPYAFQWSNGAIQNCISVNPVATTIYSCVTTDATGCTSNLQMLVKVLNSSTTPEGIAASLITSTSAQVNMTTAACYSDYKVVYRPLIPGAMSAVIYSPSLPVNLTGLTCNTLYEVYISAGMCGVYTQQAGVIFRTAACLGGAGEDRSADSDTFISTDGSMAAYPNPTTGYLHLDWETMGRLKEIQVVSIEGKLISQLYPTTESLMDLDLSAIPAGLYVIKGISESGKLVSVRILKE